MSRLGNDSEAILVKPCDTCAKVDICPGDLACVKYQTYLGARDRAAEDAQELKRLKQRTRHQVDGEEARKLYDKGMSDQEIADALETSKPAVAFWRKGQGLKINRAKIDASKTEAQSNFNSACLGRIQELMAQIRPDDTTLIRRHFADLATCILAEALTAYVIKGDKPNADA